MANLTLNYKKFINRIYILYFTKWYVAGEKLLKLKFLSNSTEVTFGERPLVEFKFKT